MFRSNLSLLSLFVSLPMVNFQFASLIRRVFLVQDIRVLDRVWTRFRGLRRCIRATPQVPDPSVSFCTEWSPSATDGLWRQLYEAWPPCLIYTVLPRIQGTYNFRSTARYGRCGSASAKGYMTHRESYHAEHRLAPDDSGISHHVKGISMPGKSGSQCLNIFSRETRNNVVADAEKQLFGSSTPVSNHRNPHHPFPSEAFVFSVSIRYTMDGYVSSSHFPSDLHCEIFLEIRY